MSKYLVLLLAGFSLAFAPAPLPRPPKADPKQGGLKSLQGTWVIVARAQGGRPVGRLVKTQLAKIVIAGERLTFYRADGRLATEWALAVDTKKSPSWFDRTRAGKGRAATVQGVYELKGDVLTMCYTRKGAERPGDFDGSKPGRWLEVYRREKR